jgi:hypothetical protein
MTTIGVAASANAEMNNAVPFMTIVKRSSKWLLPQAPILTPRPWDILGLGDPSAHQADDTLGA